MKTLPVSHVVHVAYNALSQRAEVAAHLAECINAWNQFEEMAAFFYGAVLNLWDAPPAAANTFYGPHPAALFAFQALESSRPRLNMLSNAIKLKAPDASFAKEWNQIYEKKIKTAQSARNDLTHIVWGISDSLPDAIVRRPLFKPAEAWEVADFLAVRQKIVDAMTAMLNFQQKILKHYGRC